MLLKSIFYRRLVYRTIRYLRGLVITVPRWGEDAVKIAEFPFKILTFLGLILGGFYP